MAIHSRLGTSSLAAFVGGRGPHEHEEDQSPATSLEILPDVLAMKRGESVRAQVIARFADGTSRDVSHEAEARFTSGDTSVLSVTETGLVIAGGLGVTTLRVEYRGLKAQVVSAVLANY